jgi:hypothetical protein
MLYGSDDYRLVFAAFGQATADAVSGELLQSLAEQIRTDTLHRAKRRAAHREAWATAPSSGPWKPPR